MKLIDLRSDTVTKPTAKMRQAMFEAEVGDDVYGGDPTVKKLEKYCAELFNKEAALFFPSGTMANQVAIMTHTKRGDQVITHENYHPVTHEAGGLCVLAGVFPKTIKNDNDFISVEEFLQAISNDDIHEPPTTLLCVENATYHGTVYPLKDLAELYANAKKNNINVHLDGARIFNAATALKCDVKNIGLYADSIMFCLSKGLCAPVGSILLGDKEFIKLANRYRKMLGGGMRQSGVLAAAGLIAVKDMSKRLDVDHKNAKLLEKLLIENEYITITSKVTINMVFFKINKRINRKAFYNHLLKHKILINYSDDEYRLVTNNDVSRDDVVFVSQVIRDYL